MPRYRILEKSFIGNRLVSPGDEIESDETPAGHWEPLDKTAKAASKTAAAEDAERAEAARLEAEARALKESPGALPPAPPQELARVETEVAAAAAAAEAQTAAAAETQDPGTDPLV